MGDMSIRREVTRAVCWLPPKWSGMSFRREESQGVWSRTEDRRSVLGRIGWMVITETFDVPDRVPQEA